MLGLVPEYYRRSATVAYPADRGSSQRNGRGRCTQHLGRLDPPPPRLRWASFDELECGERWWLAGRSAERAEVHLRSFRSYGGQTSRDRARSLEAAGVAPRARNEVCRSKPGRVAETRSSEARDGGGGGSRTRNRHDRQLIDGARLLVLTRSFSGSYCGSPTPPPSSRVNQNRPHSWRDIGGAGTVCPPPKLRAGSRRLHSRGQIRNDF